MPEYDENPTTQVGPVEADARHVSPGEAADALNPSVGDGSPDTAPLVGVGGKPSLLDREPWLVALFLALLPAVGSLVQALLDGEELRAAISAFVTIAIPAITLALRQKTTPLVDPKLDEDIRLVPEVVE